MHAPEESAEQLDRVAPAGSPEQPPARSQQAQEPPLLSRLSALQQLLSRDIENDVLRSLPFADGAATVDEHDEPLLSIRRLPGTDGGFEVHVQHHFRAHFGAAPGSAHPGADGDGRGSPPGGPRPATGHPAHGEDSAGGSAGSAGAPPLPPQLDHQTNSTSSDGTSELRSLSTMCSAASATPVMLAARHVRRPSGGSGGLRLSEDAQRGGGPTEARSSDGVALAAGCVAQQAGGRVGDAGQQRQQGQQGPHGGAASFEVDPRDVIIGERIAVGGFAEVFVGRYQGTLVAAKLLLAVDEEGQQRFRREVQLLESIRHPNIVLFMGWCWRPHLAILSEYMHRGSLWALLRRGGNRPLEPRMQRSVAVSVARGMAYLHGRTPALLHLDLKSPNILVNDRWQVKIADFGLSRVRSSTLVSGTGAGTPEWMSPEVLRSEGYDEHADVYSYGVVLWECLTGQLPWQGLHAMQVVGAVGFQGRSLQLPQDVADSFLADLCRRCMAQEPRQRPLFPQIMHELAAHYDVAGIMSSRHTLSEGGLVLERSEQDAAPPRRLVPAAAPPTVPTLPPLRLPLGKTRRQVRGGGSGRRGAREATGGEEAPVDRDPGPFGLAPEESWEAVGVPGAPAAGRPSPFANAEQHEAAPSTATQQAGTAAAVGALALRLHSQMSLTKASPFAHMPGFDASPSAGEGTAWRGGPTRLPSGTEVARQGSGLTTLHEHMERSVSVAAAALSLQSQASGSSRQTSSAGAAGAPAGLPHAAPEEGGCLGGSATTLPTASSPLDPPSFASVAEAAAWRRPDAQKS